MTILFVLTACNSAIAEENVAQEITVKVNGEIIEFPDQKPVINEDERTLVPVRFVSEALGAEVQWEGEIKTAFISNEDNQIQITIGERAAVTTGGNIIQLDTAATIINERTMVPLRFVSEALEANVEWDGATKTVLITTGEQEVIQEEPKVKEGKPIEVNLQDGLITKEEHWKLDDGVIESLKIKGGTLEGYLPKLPDGFYYNIFYTGLDNLGNQYQKIIFEKEGEHFKVDISNDQQGALTIMVYNEKIDAALGASGVKIPSGEVIRDGEKAGVISLEE